MIKNTSKNVSSKHLLDVQVEHIHKSSTVNVFKVSIKEGIFTVLDYSDRFGPKPDTEIYYSRYTDLVSKNSKEFKEVNKAVSDYLENNKKK